MLRRQAWDSVSGLLSVVVVATQHGNLFLRSPQDEKLKIDVMGTSIEANHY